MAELGPIPGWRCASSAVYVYDPRRERPDATLVATLPEALAPPEVYVLSVEVNLRGGDTTVWTVSRGADPDAKPSRVFVLSPGILRAVTYERATICYSQLGNWHIVGDQALQ